MSTATQPKVSLSSHSIGIGLKADHSPACLIIAYDTLEGYGELAIHASSASICGPDMCLHSPLGDLYLESVTEAVIEASEAQLPVVVLDPAREREIIIEKWQPKSN